MARTILNQFRFWMHFSFILIGCSSSEYSSFNTFISTVFNNSFTDRLLLTQKQYWPEPVWTNSFFWMHFSFIFIGCKPVCTSSVCWPDLVWTNSFFWMHFFCMLARSSLNKFLFLNAFHLHSHWLQSWLLFFNILTRSSLNQYRFFNACHLHSRWFPACFHFFWILTSSNLKKFLFLMHFNLNSHWFPAWMQFSCYLIDRMQFCAKLIGWMVPIWMAGPSFP